MNAASSAATPGAYPSRLPQELIALFPDRAFRGELVESVPDRLGVRAVDSCVKLEVHPGRPVHHYHIGIVVSRLLDYIRTIPSRDPWENESPHMNAAIPERRPATEEISGLIERVTFQNDESGF